MLTDFLKDYLSIIIFLFVSLGLSVGFIVLNFLFSPKNPDSEKLSAYECGFEAFGDSRMEFDVRFYLVAILFIIFDLEIAFLFPWAISLGKIGLFGFISMMIFLFILTVGFIYEWKLTPGRVAQLVEHLVYTERVIGSSPLPPTIWGCSSVG